MIRFLYKRRRSLVAVIQHAVWLYLRFRRSLGEGEELLVHRSVDVFCETICASTVKSGRMIAANLRRRGLPLSRRWHPDWLVSGPGQGLVVRGSQQTRPGLIDKIVFMNATRAVSPSFDASRSDGSFRKCA
jgi:hypothetical protein